MSNNQVVTPVSIPYGNSNSFQPGIQPVKRGQKIPYWLFFLFATYGPAINFMGQWRYLELVLLLLVFLNFREALSYIKTLEKKIVFLFVLTAIMYLVSDLVNNVLASETIKHVGTYLFMVILIIAVQWLSRNDPRRVKFILAGYCLSWLLLLFIGNTVHLAYNHIPWRLGLGYAVTIFVCLLVISFPRREYLGVFAIFALAVVHAILNARTLAGITALTGGCYFLVIFLNNRYPPKFRADRMVLITVLAVIGMTLGMYGLRIAVENKVFPEEMQQKMESQLAHPYGLMAAGRPEAAAAVYAISKKPFIGYGSTAFDLDVNNLFAELASYRYQSRDNFEKLRDEFFQEQRSKAIPSHSHILGAWADAGILAALCWIAFFALAIYVLARAIFWRNSWTPLYIFITLVTIWDMLFSPGPMRLDIAIRFMILIFAVRQFKVFDQSRMTGT